MQLESVRQQPCEINSSGSRQVMSERLPGRVKASRQVDFLLWEGHGGSSGKRVRAGRWEGEGQMTNQDSALKANTPWAATGQPLRTT